MKQPLTGKTVVVTRAAEQAGELIATLKHAGAEVIHLPTIEFSEPDSWQPCDHAIARLHEYDWVVYTSANGVRRFHQRLEKNGKSAADLRTKKIAAVGERTRAELQTSGVLAELVPESFSAEGLVESFRSLDVNGKWFLYPKAQQGREIVEKGLLGYGAQVHAVAVYKTHAPGKNPLAEQMKSQRVDLLTFTSPSTFRNLLGVCGREKLIAWKNSGCAFAAIGRVTADAIAQYDFTVDILPPQATVASFVTAISEYYS
ncbi:MAG: uroporphyrinogen-III synthase [bacterium]